MTERRQVLLALLGVIQLPRLPFAAPQSFIGTNYGDVADNLPPPSSTARLIRSTTISKVRLYGTDPAVVSAFAGTIISLLLGAANGDIANLASSPAAAAAWVAAHLPASSPVVSTVSVGNEVLFADATLASQLVPAMQNLYDALPPNYSVKVSTVNAMDVLASSDQPSSGTFKPELAATLDRLLAFLSKTGSPFLINPYPYFAYLSDPRPETLAFSLFQPNARRPDAGSGLTYTNMCAAALDAVRAALDAKGYKDVEIVVAETEWPHKGDADEAGATVENAHAFVSGLVSHLRSLAGRQVGGHVHLRRVRRGPQARQGVGAVLRAVPDQPHRDVPDGAAQERHGRAGTGHGAGAGTNVGAAAAAAGAGAANARAAATGDSSAAGLGGGGWAFRPLRAGDSDGKGSCRRVLSP